MVIACMILSALSRLSPPLYPPGMFGEVAGVGGGEGVDFDFDLALSICRLLAHGSSVKKEVIFYQINDINFFLEPYLFSPSLIGGLFY